MAYPNQDFGEAAPPDAGGHLGAYTTPDALFDARRRDVPIPTPPLDTRPLPGPFEKREDWVWAALAVVLLSTTAALLAVAL